MIYTNEMIESINLKKEKRKKIRKIIFFPILLIIIFFVLIYIFPKIYTKEKQYRIFWNEAFYNNDW